MASFPGGYMGGDPSQKTEIESGQIEAHEGGIRFVFTTMENMLPRTIARPTISAAELRAVTLDDSKLKRKGRLTAYAIGGVAGIAVHQATTAKRNRPLSVEAERDGESFVAIFAIAEDSARMVMAAIDHQRRVLGLEQVTDAAQAAPPAADPAVPVVGEDPLAQIERLGELRDKGFVTPEEFDAKKVELLARL